MHARHLNGGAYLIAPCVALTLALVLATSRGLVAVMDLNDLFVTFDAVWRAALGQVPHVDFPSPIGQAYYAVFRFVTQLSPASPRSVLEANALVSLAVAGASWALLKRRMSPLLFSLAVLTAAGVALSPRDHDEWITGISFVAPYNTWSWAAVTPLALAALLPPRTRTLALDAVDGGVLGLLLAWLLYLKLTFFLPAVALVLIGALFRSLPWRAAILALAVLAACIGGVEALAHNNSDYLADLRDASAVNLIASKTVRVVMLAKHLAIAAAFGGVFLALLWIACGQPSLSPWARQAWRPAFVTAIVLAVGAAIATENHPEWLNPFCFVALIGGMQAAVSHFPDLARPALRAGPAGLAAGALALLAAIRPGLDDGAVLFHAVESRLPDVVVLNDLGPMSEGLLVPRAIARRAELGIPPGSPPDKDADWRAMVTRDATLVVDGARLLQRHAAQGQVIFAADFSNPYPILVGGRPPPRALIWWDPNRSFSWSVHPPQDILCPVTMVMQRRDGYVRTQWIWVIYGATIQRDFQVVDATPNWQLWSRARPCATTQARSGRTGSPSPTAPG